MLTSKKLIRETCINSNIIFSNLVFRVKNSVKICLISCSNDLELSLFLNKIIQH